MRWPWQQPTEDRQAVGGYTQIISALIGRRPPARPNKRARRRRLRRLPAHSQELSPTRELTGRPTLPRRYPWPAPD